tara:strand:- start:1413 stop:2564 length:1152 start_codon:yes stop_codon:yes gene_type:complete
MKKIIYAYSAGRSDFDRYYPIVKNLITFKNIDFKLIPSNTHYLKKFGTTINEIKIKKIPIINRKPKLIFDYEKIVLTEGNFLSNLFKKKKPNLLIVFGDRYEMLVAATTAVAFNIPILHLYGGAVTQGSTDELNRHAITKLSNYHLVAHSKYAKRLEQLGEEKWRIKVIGMPELSYLKKLPTYSYSNIKKKTGLNLKKPTILVNFHPLTKNLENNKKYLSNLLESLKNLKYQIIFTYPNADKKNEEIIRLINTFITTKENKKKTIFIKNSGAVLYKNFLEKCIFMIGNSSSGIVESASFKIPSINIGDRQKGKVFPRNVLSCSYEINDIKKKILKTQSNSFIKKLKKIKNPYQSKLTTKHVAKIIFDLKIDKKLINKKFIDKI